MVSSLKGALNLGLECKYGGGYMKKKLIKTKVNLPKSSTVVGLHWVLDKGMSTLINQKIIWFRLLVSKIKIMVVIAQCTKWQQIVTFIEDISSINEPMLDSFFTHLNVF